MKKIFFNGVLQLRNAGVSCQQIHNAIELAIGEGMYGQAQIEAVEITVADEGPDESYKPIWIYVSPDEDEPYFLAAYSSETRHRFQLKPATHSSGK